MGWHNRLLHTINCESKKFDRTLFQAEIAQEWRFRMR